MTQENKIPSKVIPVLVAVIICDIAVADPSTGKSNLIGIFDRINVGKFPTQRPMSLFVKLTDADGYYQTQMKYVQVNTGKMIAEAKGEFHSNDKLASSNISINFPPLPIPEEGRYEFQIWANNMFLGSAFLDAIPSKITN
jgi:hypothetical protein